MIEIKGLRAHYGPIEALHGLDVTVEDGKITALIGSNGAGKTTLLKSISGMVKRTGSIVYTDKETGKSEELINKKPGHMARMHIIHVPESRHIFPGLTVEQNLETGTVNWHGFFGHESYEKELEEVFELFPRLRERRKQLGWSLSGGEQQMLAIGRAIMSKPKIMLMDEPSMGLSPLLVREIFNIIQELNRSGMTILLVEQNAKMALSIAHRAYVLETGEIVMKGKAEDMLQDDNVRKAYLGA